MITANQVHKGLALRYRGEVYEVVDFQHVKPGKGGAFVKLKLKNMVTQRVLEDTIRPEDKLEDVFMEEKHFQYLYKQQDLYVFMDLETYDQIELNKATVDHILPYLLEQMEIRAKSTPEGQLFGISLPKSVELKIVDTAPDF
ncbi:MAG: elongation factor P, partial [Planctomycetes bacterium]|nr:elongation factor P [Planctomycetota bacterium]